ncbi:hypothetical protein B0H17DRAFT_1328545 [Mycena rosella]|uniref:Uncharacterized protein n=1 Tax=Mycena rosella TaxID=1033263 RepID=A0AAD7DVB1_MYCRO|nr:hypothetical protein B0H17DRAFT_1328545 [Mycena rosella]
MPGPGRKTKAKPSSSISASGSTSADSNGARHPVVLSALILNCPKNITTRSGLKKVQANFDSIYRRLEKAYTQNASNVRIKGGTVGIYARMCVDSLLRNKLFQRGFLAQLFPLLNLPKCRRLALRSLTTTTHRGGIAIRMEIAKSGYLLLLRILKEYPDDLKTVELSIVTLSYCLISSISDEGVKIDPHLGSGPNGHPEDSDRHSRSPPVFCDVPPTSARSLKQSESDQRALDPMKLVAAVSRPVPPHLSEILRAYGFPQCETYLTMKTASNFQSAMMNCVSTRDLYSFGLSLAIFILRSEGAYQSPNPVTGQMETMNLNLPFTMWSDSLSHYLKTIRAKRVPAEADMADILEFFGTFTLAVRKISGK